MTSRELDAEVAEKVMGWKRPTRGSVTWYRSDGTGTSDAPEFSSSIGLAFQVVEKIIGPWKRPLGQGQLPSFTLSIFPDGTYRAGFAGEFYGDGSTAPEAICRAALSALTMRRSK